MKTCQQLAKKGAALPCYGLSDVFPHEWAAGIIFQHITKSLKFSQMTYLRDYN